MPQIAKTHQFECLRLYATYAMKIRSLLYISLNIFTPRVSANTVVIGLTSHVFGSVCVCYSKNLFVTTPWDDLTIKMILAS